ncbi:DUF3499 domain-containing protein [Schaalia vaccimaxillae]|uniref:DUF3499 domain-containing protein n=1 Tax=Schaalia vaccimaxillae TaxID=183916 RepID=UPI00047DB04D|nr:DUF3499 domain-containing protein [Schaalia vaccimaxillae]
MIAARHCSKPGCSRTAVATLTYDYRDSTVVIGPLATASEPNSYDMCEEHAQTLTAPKGWQIVRLVTHFEPAPPSGDDLLALVDAVRRAAQEPHPAASSAGPQTSEQRSSKNSTSRPAARSDQAPQYGPFASPQLSDAHEAETTVRQPDTTSPLDPQSPYARRRAQFTVISHTDED